MKTRRLSLLLPASLLLAFFGPGDTAAGSPENSAADSALTAQSRKRLTKAEDFGNRLAHAALDRTRHVVRYEPAYVKLDYPNGDVDPATGVCTDEVIRACRALGYDLQKLVHEDMRAAFVRYPKNWGLSRPDRNIDHRRVPNLQTYFQRQGASLAVTQDPARFLPGDLVTCTVPPHLPHIMMVVPAPDGGPRPWVVHNIGRGPQLEDCLFTYPLTGHYRWTPRQ